MCIRDRPNPLHGFEMTLLRMLAFKPNTKYEEPAKPSAKKTETPSRPAAPVEKAKPAEKIKVAAATDNWADMLSGLELTGLAFALASNCTMEKITDDTITLALAAQHEPLFNKKLAERIEQALSRYLNKPIKLQINITSAVLQTPAKAQQQAQDTRQALATEAIQKDQHVQKIVDLFNATIDPHSIKAIDPA